MCKRSLNAARRIHSEGYEPILFIALLVGHSNGVFVIEGRSGVRKLNTVCRKILKTLVLVPFETHQSKCMHGVCTQQGAA